MTALPCLPVPYRMVPAQYDTNEMPVPVPGRITEPARVTPQVVVQFRPSSVPARGLYSQPIQPA